MSRLVALLSLCLLVGGCDLFSVATNLEDACMSFADRKVDGVPVGGTLTKSFVYSNLSIADSFISIDAVVKSLSIGLKVTQGPADLSFLQSIHLSVSTDTLPAVELISCDNGECASSSAEASLEVAAPPNIMDYVLAGQLRVQITVSGDLPPDDWYADVQVCLSGSAKVKIGF